jgi:O-antigen ligase
MAVACAAPWAFGALDAKWSAAASAACLAVGGLALALRALRRDPGAALPRRQELLLVALPAVAAIGLLPISGSVRAALSPGTAEVTALDPSTAASWHPISLDPRSTLSATALAAACALVFWAVALAARDESRARTLRGMLLTAGAALAAFGLVQRLVRYDPQAIYWSVQLPDVATPFGPYVNRNHFAGAMELVGFTAAGSVLAALAGGRRSAAFAPGAAAALALVALVATTSRGALVGIAAGAAVLLLAAPRTQRRRAALAAAGAVVLVVLVVVVLGLGADLAKRFDPEEAGRWRNRFAVQRDAVRAFAGSPVFGTGAGTFAEVYPSFQSVNDVRTFGNAHSDWAQLLMETGLLGAAFAAAALAEAWRWTRDAAASVEPSRWLAAGPLAGCAALCAHGLVETNLHVPANALLAAATLSLASAASLRSRAA